MKEVKATIIVNSLEDYKKVLENPLIKFDETLKLEIDLNKISKDSFMRLLEIMDENKYRIKNQVKMDVSEPVENKLITVKDDTCKQHTTACDNTNENLEIKYDDNKFYPLQQVILMWLNIDVGPRALSFINERLIKDGYLRAKEDSSRNRIVRNTDLTAHISTNTGTNVNWKFKEVVKLIEKLFVKSDLIARLNEIKDNPVLQSGKESTRKRLEKYIELGYKSTDDLLSEVYKLTNKTKLQVVKIFNSIVCEHGYLIYNPRQGKTYDIPKDSDKLVRIDSIFYWKKDISVEFDSKGIYNELLDKLSKE